MLETKVSHKGIRVEPKSLTYTYYLNEPFITMIQSIFSFIFRLIRPGVNLINVLRVLFRTKNAFL